MLNDLFSKGKHDKRDILSIVLNDNEECAEEKSVQDILTTLHQHGKVLHISLVSDKDKMYRRVIDEYLTGILTDMTVAHDSPSLELTSEEKSILSKALSGFVNNLLYVCYDSLNIGDIRLLLRSKKYDKIVVTASRFDRSLKFKLGRLGKDFKTNVQLNLYPKRKAINLPKAFS